MRKKTEETLIEAFKNAFTDEKTMPLTFTFYLINLFSKALDLYDTRFKVIKVHSLVDGTTMLVLDTVEGMEYQVNITSVELKKRRGAE